MPSQSGLILWISPRRVFQLLNKVKVRDCSVKIAVDTIIFPSVWMLEGLKEADDIWLVADGQQSRLSTWKIS